MSKTWVTVTFQHHHLLGLFHFDVGLTEVPGRTEDFLLDKLGDSAKRNIGFFTIKLVCAV